MTGDDHNRSDVAHLLRRAGFGARPAEIEAATEAGYEATVDRLIASLGEPDAADAITPPAMQHRNSRREPPGSAQRRAEARSLTAEYRALQGWWAQRMVATDAPLKEKLTLYWHGHFATAFSKVRDVRAMYDQNQLFRSVGGGSFEILTVAVAKGEAMMRWLDTTTDKAAHPNENFAREMMELFTLGIGTYTQDDVTAAARGFTGWTTDPSTGGFRVRQRQHDDGPKTFLGHVGDFGGDDIIHLAVTDPVSIRFVAARVWSHFAYPVSPSAPVVTDLIGSYGPELNVSALLHRMFLHSDFRSPAARSGLVKQPIEYVVGAARALHLDADLQPLGAGTSSGRNGLALVEASTRLAQTLFDPPNVGGWGMNEYWLDTATALARLDIAVRMAAAADLSGMARLPAGARVGWMADALGLDGWGSATAAALGHVAGEPEALAALALTAPDYVMA